MKTLENIMQQFDMFTSENIPATHLDYYNERLKGKSIIVPEFLQKMKGIETGIYYQCRQDTNYEGKVFYYIEHYYTIVLAEGSNIPCMLMEHKGKKYFHPLYNLSYKYNGIYYPNKNEAINKLSQPNYIGVFTTTKVNQWLQYCEEYIKTMDKLLNETDNKNAEIQAKIDDFINSMPKTANVSTYQNRTIIETPLFYVSFEHLKESTYLKTQITYKGSLESIVKISNQF